MTLGERLQKLRKNSGMTQEGLAEKLNITRQTISKWECGESTPDYHYLIEISDLFHVTTDYLLKEEQPANEPSVFAGQATTEYTKARKFNEQSLLGACLLVVGFITNLTLFVLSVVYPIHWYGIIGNHSVSFDGLMGFLLWKDVLWLFVVMCFAIVIGLVMLIYGCTYHDKK